MLVDELLPAAKRHMSISHDSSDALVKDMLAASIELVETHYGVAIYRREQHEGAARGLYRPQFKPDGNIVVANGRTRAVEGDGRLSIEADCAVAYTCGYETAEQIPYGIRQALFRLTLYQHEHRGDAVNRVDFGAAMTGMSGIGNIFAESGAATFLKPYRVMAA
ncbi:MAG: hypothetical protein AB7F96_16420 [Beijerinckiaceae bacterium]